MHDKMYYTYIVASRSHNLYIGMTSEIEIRVRQHKAGTFEGYSSDYNCNRLVYFERHPYVNDAIAAKNNSKAGVVKRRSGSSNALTQPGTISAKLGGHTASTLQTKTQVLRLRPVQTAHRTPLRMTITIPELFLHLSTKLSS